MTAWRGARQGLLVLVVSAMAICAHAQAPAKQEFTPTVGQSGKDVVWVPSPQALVDKMLDMAKVTPADFVMDLGSGDGRTVITAAKRGVRALGIEYNPDMVALSRRNAAAAGVSDRASFVQGDIFESDLSRATVITLFLLPDLNLRLRPTLLSMKPGLRVVSNSFKMGEWEPDQVFELGCDTYCTAYLWIVPARVQGKWQLTRGQGELTLNQEFQRITGTLKSGAASVQISGGKLRGERISFVAGGAEYRGRVVDRAIEGTVKTGGTTVPWGARL
ncbi:MAG: RNA methyltransferase [Betaproteobacteria bacterium RIFCSPLOWO2_02_FULL_65_20]|nr:MAG: RNA methyltransferase [Betaproteobacteria bacterium RIFCSPLOWO2_02_FULL_65_20]